MTLIGVPSWAVWVSHCPKPAATGRETLFFPSEATFRGFIRHPSTEFSRYLTTLGSLRGPLTRGRTKHGVGRAAPHPGVPAGWNCRDRSWGSLAGSGPTSPDGVRERRKCLLVVIRREGEVEERRLSVCSCLAREDCTSTFSAGPQAPR